MKVATIALAPFPTCHTVPKARVCCRTRVATWSDPSLASGKTLGFMKYEVDISRTLISPQWVQTCLFSLDMRFRKFKLVILSTLSLQLSISLSSFESNFAPVMQVL